MLVALHKHYSVEEWVAFCESKPDVVPFVAASAGTSEADFLKLKAQKQSLRTEHAAFVTCFLSHLVAGNSLQD